MTKLHQQNILQISLVLLLTVLSWALVHSLIHIYTLREFLEHSNIHLDLEKVSKVSREAQGDNQVNNYNMDTLQVIGCMCDFLVGF